LLQDTIRAREAAEHLRALRADAARAARQLEATAEPNLGRPSPGPSP
jgi:hypothetical protein